MSLAFKIKGLDAVIRRSQKALQTQKSDFVEIGEFTSKRIQSKTRTGKGVDGNNETKLKPLSLDYKTFRKKNQSIRKGAFFKANKSNLTLTGQLLDAVTFKAVNNNVGITFKSNRKKTRPNEKPITNSKIATFHQDGPRPFIGLDKVGLKRVLNIFRRALRDRFRR